MITLNKISTLNVPKYDSFEFSVIKRKISGPDCSIFKQGQDFPFVLNLIYNFRSLQTEIFETECSIMPFKNILFKKCFISKFYILRISESYIYFFTSHILAMDNNSNYISFCYFSIIRCFVQPH